MERPVKQERVILRPLNRAPSSEDSHKLLNPRSSDPSYFEEHNPALSKPRRAKSLEREDRGVRHSEDLDSCEKTQQICFFSANCGPLEELSQDFSTGTSSNLGSLNLKMNRFDVNSTVNSRSPSPNRGFFFHRQESLTNSNDSQNTKGMFDEVLKEINNEVNSYQESKQPGGEDRWATDSFWYELERKINNQINKTKSFFKDIVSGDGSSNNIAKGVWAQIKENVKLEKKTWEETVELITNSLLLIESLVNSETEGCESNSSFDDQSNSANQGFSCQEKNSFVNLESDSGLVVASNNQDKLSSPGGSKASQETVTPEYAECILRIVQNPCQHLSWVTSRKDCDATNIDDEGASSAGESPDTSCKRFKGDEERPRRHLHPIDFSEEKIKAITVILNTNLESTNKLEAIKNLKKVPKCLTEIATGKKLTVVQRDMAMDTIRGMFQNRQEKQERKERFTPQEIRDIVHAIISDNNPDSY